MNVNVTETKRANNIIRINSNSPLKSKNQKRKQENTDSNLSLKSKAFTQIKETKRKRTILYVQFK